MSGDNLSYRKTINLDEDHEQGFGILASRDASDQSMQKQLQPRNTRNTRKRERAPRPDAAWSVVGSLDLKAGPKNSVRFLFQNQLHVSHRFPCIPSIPWFTHANAAKFHS